MMIKSSLTVLFDAPFWIGLYERTYNDKYEVCKITFGSEPKDYEVYQFLLSHWHKLNFSPAIQTDKTTDRKINPKRMHREINKQIRNTQIGTKAQQALKIQHEQQKELFKSKKRENKENRKERQFILRQEKKKAKHKGK